MNVPTTDPVRGSPVPRPPDGSAGPCRSLHRSLWRSLVDAAQDLVPSQQPAVVLASPAAISVPTSSDRCHALAQEGAEDHRQIGV